MKGTLSFECRVKYEKEASGCNILYADVRVYGQRPVQTPSVSLKCKWFHA